MDEMAGRFPKVVCCGGIEDRAGALREASKVDEGDMEPVFCQRVDVSMAENCLWSGNRLFPGHLFGELRKMGVVIFGDTGFRKRTLFYTEDERSSPIAGIVAVFGRHCRNPLG